MDKGLEPEISHPKAAHKAALVGPSTFLAQCGAGLRRLVASPAMFLVGAGALTAGCQVQAVSTVQLQYHQQVISLDGLRSVEPVPELDVSLAPPRGWERMSEPDTVLYTHEQWRSPEKNTGIGVAYLRTPFPLSPHMLIWFARLQYGKPRPNRHIEEGSGGQMLGEWDDAMGRSWFEAENSKYHVKGYAMTRGNDAWVVYSGWRVAQKPSEADIELAARAADSIVPLPVGWKAPPLLQFDEPATAPSTESSQER